MNCVNVYHREEAEALREVAQLVEEGHIIRAIRAFRDRFGTSLTVARQAITLVRVAQGATIRCLE